MSRADSSVKVVCVSALSLISQPFVILTQFLSFLNVSVLERVRAFTIPPFNTYALLPPPQKKKKEKKKKKQNKNNNNKNNKNKTKQKITTTKSNNKQNKKQNSPPPLFFYSPKSATSNVSIEC